MTDYQLLDTLPGQRYRNQKDGKYKDFADAVRANPGKWGLLPYDGVAKAHSVAGSIRRGVYRDFPRGEFQIASRNNEIYVRFVGGA